MNDALSTALRQLRLSGMLQSLEVRLQEAAGHGLSTGQAVVYRHDDGATDVGGLVEGATYYVIRTGDDKLKLAASREDAMAGTALDLTSIGSGIGQHLEALDPR